MADRLEIRLLAASQTQMQQILRIVPAMALALLLAGGGIAAAADDGQPGEWRGSVLRPGDQLAIKVFRGQEFDRTIPVEDDGKFTFPFCGAVQAAGRTPREVGEDLQRLLSAQIANPHVDVSVAEWTPRTIYLLGEFKGGSVSLDLPIYSPMTALQAISVAGGFTDLVDLARVAVLRRSPDGSSVERIAIDVSELYGGTGGGQSALVMQPDDTLLAPRAAPVNVSGAIHTPGAYSIDTKRPPHCSELLIRAGGCVTGADVGRIMIIRQDEKGERMTIPVSLKSVSLGTYENDVLVMPGDNVFVGQADQIYVMGFVKQPQGLVLPPNLEITVSQAIALAGGLMPTASRSDISVIRGKQRLKVDLSRLYRKGEISGDVKLEYGDIIYVPESFW